MKFNIKTVAIMVMMLMLGVGGGALLNDAITPEPEPVVQKVVEEVPAIPDICLEAIDYAETNINLLDGYSYILDDSLASEEDNWMRLIIGDTGALTDRASDLRRMSYDIQQIKDNVKIKEYRTARSECLRLK